MSVPLHPTIYLQQRGPMVRLLVCGDRNWTCKETISKFIRDLGGIECIIEGEARGADSVARDIGLALGLRVLKFPASWEKYGRAAGMLRNRQMLEDGKPTFLVAFHDAIASSKGTKHMVNLAKAHGVPGVVINSRGQTVETWE